MLTQNLSSAWTNSRGVVVLPLWDRTIRIMSTKYCKDFDYVYAYEECFCVPSISFNWKVCQIGSTVQRIQVQVKLAYANTYNLSQRTTLECTVVDTHNAIFAHGQPYVALSRECDANACASCVPQTRCCSA
jgi:hypothetical protein